MTRLDRPVAFLDYLFQLGLLLVLCGILTAAAVLQYARGEIPCPLCLLERLAMFGIGFGVLLNLRTGFSDRNTGISLVFAVLLLIIGARQTLLDIYPRPGHEYVGSAILGLHMPVWSVVIALCVLAAFALKLAILGGDDHRRANPLDSFPVLPAAATALGALLVVLCAVNFGSAVVQCGLGECHTEGYRLLGTKLPAD
jgi:disulfide bond formation protein DsbB